MMSYQYSLQKVMEFKEKEKTNAEAEYQDAITQFETVATRLYNLLKHKEELESKAREEISSGTSIFDLRQSQNLMLHVQQEIQELQHLTQLAREKMNQKQDELLNKSIEYKKYEKMKQLKLEQYKQEQKRIELIEMDEISLQMYANR